MSVSVYRMRYPLRLWAGRSSVAGTMGRSRPARNIPPIERVEWRRGSRYLSESVL